MAFTGGLCVDVCNGKGGFALVRVFGFRGCCMLDKAWFDGCKN